MSPSLEKINKALSTVVKCSMSMFASWRLKASVERKLLTMLAGDVRVKLTDNAINSFGGTKALFKIDSCVDVSYGTVPASGQSCVDPYLSCIQ